MGSGPYLAADEEFAGATQKPLLFVVSVIPAGMAQVNAVVPSYHELNAGSLVSARMIVFDVPSRQDFMFRPGAPR